MAALGPLSFILGALLFLALSGCGMSPAQRTQIAEDTVTTAQQTLDDLGDQLPDVRAEVARLETLVANSEGQIAEEAGRLLAQAREALALLETKEADTRNALDAARSKLAEINAAGNVTWADELEAAGVTLRASAPLFGTHGWIATLTGGVLTFVAGIFGVRRAKALDEVRRGVDQALEQLPPEHRFNTKETLKAHQSLTTRNLIHRLQAA
jgi:hypothetical protein